MKKLFTILAIACATTLVHAQGVVYMYGGAHISTNTSLSTFVSGSGTGGVSGLTAGFASGQIYDYALLYSSASTAPATTAVGLTSGWTFSGLTATNLNGTGSIGGPGGASGAAISGVPSASTIDVVIVGWSANLGTTWQTISAELLKGNWVESGFFGISGVGSVIAGGGNLPQANVFGGTGIPQSGFSLYSVGTTVVPEPTTIALIGLGGLGLAMIRRRK